MKSKKSLIAIGIALIVFAPLIASAGLVPCGGTGASDTPTVPCNLCHLFTLIQKILNFLAWIIAPTLAVLVIAVGGFKIMLSGPKPGLRNEGIDAIKIAITGLLIVFAAWVVINETLLFFTNTPVDGAAKLNIAEIPLPWHKIECVTPDTSIIAEQTTNITNTQVVSGGSESHIGEGPVMKAPPIIKQGTVSIANLSKIPIPKETSHMYIDILKKQKVMNIWYYQNNKWQIMATAPINIGSKDQSGNLIGGDKDDKITPVGEFRITANIRKNATSGVYNNEGVPMGTAFFGLNAKDQNGDYRGIGIHGDALDAVSSTAGCVKMKNADLNVLTKILKPEIRVRIQNY